MRCNFQYMVWAEYCATFLFEPGSCTIGLCFFMCLTAKKKKKQHPGLITSKSITWNFYNFLKVLYGDCCSQGTFSPSHWRLLDLHPLYLILGSMKQPRWKHSCLILPQVYCRCHSTHHKLYNDLEMPPLSFVYKEKSLGWSSIWLKCLHLCRQNKGHYLYWEGETCTMLYMGWVISLWGIFCL